MIASYGGGFFFGRFHSKLKTAVDPAEVPGMSWRPTDRLGKLEEFEKKKKKNYFISQGTFPFLKHKFFVKSVT